MAQYIATPSWLGRFFTRIKHVSIEQTELVVHFKNAQTQRFLIKDFYNFAALNNHVFSAKIILSDDRNTSISFLNKAQAHALSYTINNQFSQLLEQKVNNAKAVLKRYALDEFLRDSSLKTLKNNVFLLGSHYNKSKSTWLEHLSPASIKFLNILSSTPDNAQAVVLLRQKYEQKQLALKNDFFNKIESNPLTIEQRLAVIRDNDKNLVLAAAGTGKTSVMVAKALNLITSDIAKPEQILVLAYNKSAANELKERFINRAVQAKLPCKTPTILTFHALGLKLLQSAKKPVELSKFATDPILLNSWLTQWVSKKLQADPKFLKTFVDLLHEPIDIFSFNNNAEYERYVRDNEYRSLAGHKVKGYQELLISNWLHLHSVPHSYEATYQPIYTEQLQSKYQPDFYIPQYNLYLEHFGIDRRGNTRADIDKKHYNEQIAFKRKLHKQNGTTLLETFHYNWLEGKLEQTLAKQLKQHNVELVPLSSDEIFHTLNNSGQLQQGVDKYIKCLQAIRVEQLSHQQIEQRIKQSAIKNYKQYAALLMQIHDAYINELSLHNSIDFDDMIIQATRAVKNGDFKVPWSHILVDEFQDISSARMAFLNAIIKHGNGIRFTAVGDDWQAIYRFSGGNLALTTQFNELVGSHSLTMLQKTFRYNNSISDVAGRFVMQNPEQYKKHIITHTQVTAPQVILLDDLYQGTKSIEIKVQQTISTIEKNDASASIAILSRYRYMLNDVQQHLKGKKRTNPLYFWTLHSAKGLEADYCIIIGFEQGKLGFPSDSQDNLLVDTLLPKQDSFTHSQERRLLYVGITRAKHKSYLIADPYACSAFIKELINDDYPIHLASDLFKKSQLQQRQCITCSDGLIRPKSGKYGDYFSCTNTQLCKTKLRVCKSCRSPSVDKATYSQCTNQECRARQPICEKCGREMRLRQSKHGEFLGCSGYALKEHNCKNTRKVKNNVISN
ncbi:UvrD-helicase domain-containing protein [Pseudoalteromonas carrageenovora]|uniref:UvrD-helicase domain-containing protein n=1 Tax=Pseudoalteromonas carrageenovora TaxID=227 RepID=UPI0026E42EA8|nr:UvrD-helicase domain-containing protein [Pseudoalteromonas carrageenovora]MDO6837261.1 UvrD-helicase domain-containing protein [Pseudoalteromonas carrageenovora]